MSLILNDIHLPLLIKTTLSENHQYKALPWNNLDQLSSLWAVFTKYKRNIQDGFRLENLSWRLWYRQSVLQKKVEPKTSEDIDFSTASASTSSKQLTRTRSLPDLSQWSQQKQFLETSGQDMHVKQKFFISAKDGVHLNDEDEEEEEEPEQLMFAKKTTRFNSFSSTASSALSKPVSLLTDMLQRTESNVSLVTNSGLRRCQSKYCRLDQFFLNAA
ncbi:hypothetical protein V8B55DRAFT_1531798 [Mucor lusitanicus]|uniref:Nitrogen regulatory protein areA GATA-like domain-containing protein n=2 Tax=Mucor circinelloides f. lusitanicus TaxID=29924 RepID=A0A168IMB3_MUCCL|nr:hypothetical protein FB192DRAFT_1382843 [Mucor lusitanicus]OAD00114.1 hypothetical protein MUCCIDRAFT_156974 [Mucor lusitanicus CBS 277.49]